LAPKAQD
jgi:hypothetical protein